MTEMTSLPAEYYTDSQIFEQEIEQVFRSSWQYVGDTSRLSKAGDFLMRHINETSVLAVRDDNGMLRAFYNVCAHRGSQIEDETAGNRSRFQCPYHAWTYSLTGELTKTPNFPGKKPVFEKNECGLTSLPVSTFGPLAFVSLETTEAAVRELLAPITETFDQYAVDEFEYVCSDTHSIDCNWKVYIDNYLECDHCQFNHPSFTAAVDMDTYDIECYNALVVQSAPLSAEGIRDKTPSVVSRSAADRYFSVWMWPNVTIDIAPWTMEIGYVNPVSPNRTVVYSEFFNRSGEQTPEWSRSYEYSKQIMAEDVALCERHQKGLSSGGFQTGPLSPTEQGLRHFQRKIRSQLET
mgnify:CR=1 FL=1